MTDSIDWLTIFGARHKDVSSPRVYWLSLPVLLVGIVGLLWVLPVPEELQTISPIMNWGTVFLMAALVYYFIISLSLGIGMIPFIVAVIALQVRISEMGLPQGYVASVMVGLGFAGLTFGHYAAGGIRGVLQDLQLLMIAPVWLLSVLYRRLGIPF